MTQALRSEYVVMEQERGEELDRAGTGYSLVRVAGSFEAFYQSEYDACVRLAYVLSGSRWGAEDVAQEAFSYDVSAIETAGDDVWFATLGDGVYRYSGGSWTFYGVSAGIPNPRVTGLAVDSAGSLWLAFSRSNPPERLVLFDPGS